MALSGYPDRWLALLDQGPVSWRPTTVKCRQSSQSNRHSTISTRQTQYHEALPSSANDEVRCDCTFPNDGNASWYSVCRVPMVEWRLDYEDCRHLTVVGIHDTGTRARTGWNGIRILWLGERHKYDLQILSQWSSMSKCQRVTCGVTVAMSAFLACHQCYYVGSSLAWGLNLQALLCGTFWSSLPGAFSRYSSFLPSFIG